MSRFRGRGARSRLAAVTILATAGAVGAAPDRLAFPRDEAVIRAAREYFDESAEAWRGRIRFQEALAGAGAEGLEPLRDLDWLGQILLQGRSFREPFDSAAWRREVGAHLTSEGPLTDVDAPDLRVTVGLPRDAKSQAALARIPRPDPWPLLLVLHEPADDPTGGRPFPGHNALRRWWPKAAFGSIYDEWMVLAPAAAGGGFVAEDGTVRQDLTTLPLRELWQRYHVDFDRIVLDGADAALALAAAQPVFFAGLVLRGGTVTPGLVRNFAALPVYVVGNPALAQALEAAGHRAVTLGEPAGLLPWLAERRRALPTTFSWVVGKPDHLLAHWVSLERLEEEAVSRRLDVAVDRESGRIRIDAVGVASLRVFLNDRIVDLDREIDLVVNGVAQQVRLERDFDRLLQGGPLSVRRTLYLGWLFPADLPDVPVGPAAPPAGPLPGPEPSLGAPTALLDRALADFLLGRPDLTAAALRDLPVATEAWPGALVDHWWRPRGDPGDVTRLESVVGALAAGPMDTRMGELFGWLAVRTLVSPPASSVTEDPHRVYLAMAADRVARETAGLGSIPSGPLQALRGESRVGETVRWFLDDVQKPAYAGPADDPAGEPARLARGLGPRNAWLAVLAVGGLVLGAAGLARWARPRAGRPPGG